MKDARKGILQIFAVVIVIALLTTIAFIGIGKDHKGSTKNIRLGLDLAGGVSVTYEAAKNDPTSEEMSDTIYKMRKRVDDQNYTEADVYQEGANRVNIDIPNVKNPEEVLEQLGKAGSIYFVDPDNEWEGDEIEYTSLSGTKETGTLVLDGSDVETAKAMQQQDEGANKDIENVVKLTLKASGAKKFADITATKATNRAAISIIYDGNEISSPGVESAITDGVAIISGSFDEFDKAKELASTIRVGALPLELKEIRSNVVGAKLGEEAINTSLLAGLIGLILVMLFMIIYYKVPGVAASIALLIYVGATSFVLNALDVTLTLPGIAGILLSIGMAVDANVIIFTRIKEELATGKTVRSAIDLGFNKALSAIVDGNVTTLIAAAVLWFKGSGTVKGFAQTLAIGIILSMFTALFVTKFILMSFYHVGCDDVKYFGIQKTVKVFGFVKNTKKFFAISGLLFLICIAGLVFNKVNTGEILNYGLDFKGGTSTTITFPEDAKVDKAFKQDVVKMFKDVANETAEISDVEGSNAILVRTKELNQKQRKDVSAKLVSDFKVDKQNIETESISATVSNEMKGDAVIAVIIAAICMLLYIWVRFKDFNFGASAVLALIHDVVVVLLVYAVFSHFISVGNTFIACMLTIVGYSINATIVIFDRIRENLKGRRGKVTTEEVVNTSISQTISRSINTSLTTFIMVFMLVILGVDSVRQFAIPLMVGIVCGAYSSICITGTLWMSLKKTFSRKKA